MGAVGLATGLTVRLGQELSQSVTRAKRIAAWCMGFAIVMGLLVSFPLYWFRVSIIRLFSNDEQVFQVSCIGEWYPGKLNIRPTLNLCSSSRNGQGCMNVWGRVCVFVFILYIFSINRAILRALGMQWRIAGVVVTCLWCVALPTILYTAVHLKQGVDAVWTILPLSYALMQVLLILSYTRTDWSKICDETIGNEEDHASTVTFDTNDVEMESLNPP